MFKSPEDFQEKVFKHVWDGVVAWVTSFWTFFWLPGGEVIRSQYHQPSGSKWSGICVLLGSIQLTSLPGGGFNYCKKTQRTWLRILSTASEVKWSENHSVMSNSLQPHGVYGPWNSPGQNTGVCSHSLLQAIFSTQESTQVSHIAGGFFTSWATRKTLEGELKFLDFF